MLGLRIHTYTPFTNRTGHPHTPVAFGQRKNKRDSKRSPKPAARLVVRRHARFPRTLDRDKAESQKNEFLCVPSQTERGEYDETCSFGPLGTYAHTTPGRRLFAARFSCRLYGISRENVTPKQFVVSPPVSYLQYAFIFVAKQNWLNVSNYWT